MAEQRKVRNPNINWYGKVRKRQLENTGIVEGEESIVFTPQKPDYERDALGRPVKAMRAIRRLLTREQLDYIERRMRHGADGRGGEAPDIIAQDVIVMLDASQRDMAEEHLMELLATLDRHRAVIPSTRHMQGGPRYIITNQRGFDSDVEWIRQEFSKKNYAYVKRRATDVSKRSECRKRANINREELLNFLIGEGGVEVIDTRRAAEHFGVSIPTVLKYSREYGINVRKKPDKYKSTVSEETLRPYIKDGRLLLEDAVKDTGLSREIIKLSAARLGVPIAFPAEKRGKG